MPYKSLLVGNSGLMLTMMNKTFFMDEGGREGLSYRITSRYALLKSII